MSTSMMRCPVCGALSTVLAGRSGHLKVNNELPRTRECKGDPKHQFPTLERVAGLMLAQIAVRTAPTQEKGGMGGKRPYVLFDQSRIRIDLQRYVLGSLSKPEIDEIVNLVVQRIDENLRDIAVDLQEQKFDDCTHFIRHEDVSKEVLSALKSFGRLPGGGGSARHRVAHVLYALATLGSVAGRKGWRHASEAATWMSNEYSDLPHLPPLEAERARPGSDEWWRPADGPPDLPAIVVKRHSKVRRPRSENNRSDQGSTAEVGPSGAISDLELDDQLGPAIGGVPTEPFIREKFVQSISSALAGRGNQKHIASTSRNIADWVLWNLVGQKVVLTSQLGSGVAECLRRHDDIAYLRWVTVGKELRVSLIYQEALGLITYPSPGLEFNPKSRPRPLPNKRLPDEDLGEFSTDMQRPSRE